MRYQISKSCALPGFSTRLVKDAFEVIIPELTYLCNKCQELGDLLESWWLGTISHIPKTTVNTVLVLRTGIESQSVTGQIFENICSL